MQRLNQLPGSVFDMKYEKSNIKYNRDTYLNQIDQKFKVKNRKFLKYDVFQGIKKIQNKALACLV